MSIFTYIFFPREVDDPRYLSNCYIHNISYEKADNMGFTPWFAKWNESIISENEYLSLTLFKRGGSERFPFVRNFFAYALVEDMSDAFTHGKAEYYKRSFWEKAIDVVLEHITIDCISRHQLYHLINDNIESGESVEIYSQWLDWDAPDIWGPPEHTYELSLKEIFDNRKFYISTEKNDLYIIHKP